MTAVRRGSHTAQEQCKHGGMCLNHRGPRFLSDVYMNCYCCQVKVQAPELQGPLMSEV